MRLVVSGIFFLFSMYVLVSVVDSRHDVDDTDIRWTYIEDQAQKSVK